MALTKRVSVQQAGMNALATWLAAQSELAGVKIFDRWPEADQKLPARGISLLMAGAPEDTYVHNELVEVTAAAGNEVDTKWWAKVRRQNIQLDVWARDDMGRDDILAIWDELSHKGPLYTLGSVGGDPISDGITLALDEAEYGHEGFASFTFDPPILEDNASLRQRREFRATIPGILDVSLHVTARTPKIARAILQQTINGGTFPDLIVTEAS